MIHTSYTIYYIGNWSNDNLKPSKNSDNEPQNINNNTNNIFDFGTQMSNQTQAKNIQDLYKQPTIQTNQQFAFNFANQSNLIGNYMGNPMGSYMGNPIGNPIGNPMSNSIANPMGNPMGQVNFGNFMYASRFDIGLGHPQMNFFHQTGQGNAFGTQTGFISNQQQQFNTGFGGFNNTQPFGQNVGFNQSLPQVPSENFSSSYGSKPVPFSQQVPSENANKSNQPEAFDDFQTAKSFTPNVD